MGKDFHEFCGRAVVEAPFAFREEEMKVLPWYSVVSTQVTLGLAPEILDAVDMVPAVSEARAVMDAIMMELRDIEFVVCVP